MRCCGNCEWSISPSCEEEIMRENHYEEDDPKRPRAGDCCLGIEHNGEYVCREHEYLSGGIDNYVFYDSTYLGPGYFIVTQYYDEIIKFIKLYQFGNGFPNFAIRGYEVGSTDKRTLEYGDTFRKIEIELSKINTLNGNLLMAIKDFASRLKDNSIPSIDIAMHGMSNLSSLSDRGSGSIILSKDIYGCKNNNDYIDINLGGYSTCDYYKDISLLFRNLAWASSNRTDENAMKRILKMTK